MTYPLPCLPAPSLPSGASISGASSATRDGGRGRDLQTVAVGHRAKRHSLMSLARLFRGGPVAYWSGAN